MRGASTSSSSSAVTSGVRDVSHSALNSIPASQSPPFSLSLPSPVTLRSASREHVMPDRNSLSMDFSLSPVPMNESAAGAVGTKTIEESHADVGGHEQSSLDLHLSPLSASASASLRTDDDALANLA